MHLTMLVLATVIAWALRCPALDPSASWNQRWHRALGQFLFPPLLLLMTAIAIIWMGSQNPLMAPSFGWISYGLALGFGGMALLLGLKLGWEARQSIRQILTYPPLQIQGRAGYLLDSSLPFVAQVGLWRSRLVVSQGLLAMLSAPHLEAVLVHEQAHVIYRDTFWFFLLGWLRRLTFWLPQTEVLRQELLTLRELRADGWAAQQVDHLLLAEALLLLAGSPIVVSDTVAAFSQPVPQQLTQRIEALLGETEPIRPLSVAFWGWLLLTGLPLITIPFHSLSHQHFCLLMGH